MMEEKKEGRITKFFSNLHPLTLLFVLVIVVAVLTFFIPAGTYDRVNDEASGKTIVVPGTFHRVEQNPATPITILLSFDKGIQKAAPIISFLLL
ncbi:MAG: hypothetical protein ACLT46_17470, partial [Hungatella sp.]